MSWLAARAGASPVVPDTLRRVLERRSPRLLALAPPPGAALAADLGRASTGQGRAVAEAIRDELGHGSPVALGLGAHPTIAFLAALAAEPGELVAVPLGQEDTWLAPQPVALLASAHSALGRRPLDAALVARLRRFGLHNAGAVAALPPDALEAQFGPVGRRLHALASGQLLPAPPAEAPPPSIRVGWRFAGPVTDHRAVDAALDRVTARLAARLARSGHAVRRLALTLDLADAPAQRAERMLAEPTGEAAALRAALGGMSRATQAPCGVECLMVEAELAPAQAAQRELFPASPPRAEQLGALVARLAPRHATHLVRAEVARPDAVCLEQRVTFAPWEAP